MKRKMKLFSALAIFAVAMGVNASLKSSNSSENVSLSNLVNASSANAECVSTSFNNGRCGISNNCFWGSGNNYDCDTTRG